MDLLCCFESVQNNIWCRSVGGRFSGLSLSCRRSANNRKFTSSQPKGRRCHNVDIRQSKTLTEIAWGNDSAHQKLDIQGSWISRPSSWSKISGDWMKREAMRWQGNFRTNSLSVAVKPWNSDRVGRMADLRLLYPLTRAFAWGLTKLLIGYFPL